ncbi:hypothetical protein FS837_008767 [Tulasnella sp. UAMH 9824]|nr:hypothetical protein FS837_008767 [Tulasnella sp. UAMH 9824]
MSTYVVGVSGVKYWFYVQWIAEPAPASLAFRIQAASDHNLMSIEYSSQPPWVVYDGETQKFTFDESIYAAEASREWEEQHPKVSQIYMIPLKPGMCIVQPSNAVHAVYNATDCVATGGHFISYESLPLVELARLADHISKKPLTNDCHASINLILQGMCLLLNDRAGPPPSLPVLRSLTRMILSPLAYSTRVSTMPEDFEVVQDCMMSVPEDIEVVHDGIMPRVNEVLKAKLLEAGLELPPPLM